MKRLKLSWYIFLSAIIAVPLYILLHESGHAIVMLSAGADIVDFSIFTAHVSAVNGNYTSLSDLWLNANGRVLPIVICWIYGLLYKKNSQNTFYRIFSYFFMLIPASSMLAWVVIPFLYLSGSAPLNDDVTKFLFNFSQGHSPLIVSAVAAAIILVSIYIIVSKHIFKNYVDEVKSVK